MKRRNHALNRIFQVLACLLLGIFFRTSSFALNLEQRQDDLIMLGKIKLALIRGDLDYAKELIGEYHPLLISNELIKKRYALMVAFIQRDFEKVLELAKDPSFARSATFTKICTMKIVARLATFKNDKSNNQKEAKALQKDMDFCSHYLFSNSPSKLFWLKTLVRIALNEEDLIQPQKLQDLLQNYKDFSPSDLRLWLKLALFLNKEKDFAPVVNKLHPSYYQDSALRELMGMIEYRAGNYPLAYNFVEDLSTPNAENIKGNQKLAEKKYELAYGYFALALKKKRNSLNAVERALPLTWMLQKWEEGHDLTTKMRSTLGTLPNKLTLLAAFLVRSQAFDKAYQRLQEVERIFQGELPLEVNLLMAYTTLMLHQEGQEQQFQEEATKYADKACQQYDLMSCLWLIDLSLWPNLAKTIRDREAPPPLDQNGLNLEELKNETTATPIQESVFIQQKEIEELDHLEFKLWVEPEASATTKAEAP
jgi:hypothetical protein